MAHKGGNSHQRALRNKRPQFGSRGRSALIAEDSGTPHPPDPAPPADHIPEATIGIIGLVLAVLGVADNFPLAINLIFYLLGLVAALYAVHLWLSSSHRRLSVQAAAYGVALILYIGFISFPIWKQYQANINLNATFKSSPQFTWWRRQVITHDVARTRDFLVSLGIKVPTEIPPFAIQTGENSGDEGLVTPPNSPLYRSALVIGETKVSDRRTATSVYIAYVVQSRTEHTLAESQGIMDIANLGILDDGFTCYFNAGFWNQTLPGCLWPPTKALLALRKGLGSTLADNLAAAAFNSIADSSGELRSNDFHVYFTRAIKIADSIVDNDCARWPEISHILISNGIPADIVTSSDLSAASVPTACVTAWKTGQ